MYGKALISPLAIASLSRNIQNNISQGSIRIKSGFVSENEHEILKKQKSLRDETQKGSEVCGQALAACLKSRLKGLDTWS